jgi:hypothetical protein
MNRLCTLSWLEDQAKMTRMGVVTGVAAVRSGVKVPTIGYDEEIGLLQAPRAQRATGGTTLRQTSANSSLSAMHARPGRETM